MGIEQDLGLEYGPFFSLLLIAINGQLSIFFFLCWLSSSTTLVKKKPGEVSAYAAFNKDCKPINGTLRAEDFEREILHKPAEFEREEEEEEEELEEQLKKSSKAKPNKVKRNDTCKCGSGKKFKKCCGDEAWLAKQKYKPEIYGESDESD